MREGCSGVALVASTFAEETGQFCSTFWAYALILQPARSSAMPEEKQRPAAEGRSGQAEAVLHGKSVCAGPSSDLSRGRLVLNRGGCDGVAEEC